MAAFYAFDPALSRMRQVPVAGSALADGVENAAGEIAFNRPSRRPATRPSVAGARVRTYGFDYAAPAPAPVFGAAHCIELPVPFGTEADWATAPMLVGARPQDIEPLGRRVRIAWLGFIRTGTQAPPPPTTLHSRSTPRIPLSPTSGNPEVLQFSPPEARCAAVFRRDTARRVLSSRLLCHCWCSRSNASRNAALEVTPSLGKSW